MTIEQVKLTVELSGHYYHHWPYVKILHNNESLFDGEIINHQTLIFNLTCPQTNKIQFIHYGKQFGENNVWDSNPDTNEQCYVTVDDIKFNDVSIGEKFKSGQLSFIAHWSDLQLKNNPKEFIDEYSNFLSYGAMNFNGEINIDFETPVYNWLILSKYKVPLTDLAYFSNYTLRWHYEEDLKIIEEIKELINFDKDCRS
jgi:hypothetical protein